MTRNKDKVFGKRFIVERMPTENKMFYRIYDRQCDETVMEDSMSTLQSQEFFLDIVRRLNEGCSDRLCIQFRSCMGILKYHVYDIIDKSCLMRSDHISKCVDFVCDKKQNPSTVPNIPNIPNIPPIKNPKRFTIKVQNNKYYVFDNFRENAIAECNYDIDCWLRIREMNNSEPEIRGRFTILPIYGELQVSHGIYDSFKQKFIQVGSSFYCDYKMNKLIDKQESGCTCKHCGYNDKADVKAANRMIKKDQTMKMIRVEMRDGSQWDIPSEIVAHYRARYVISQHGFSDDKSSTYKNVYEETMGDETILLDWAEMSMPWDLVKQFAICHKKMDESSYKNEWQNGHKSVVSI